jgi:hypothetical protein
MDQDPNMQKIPDPTKSGSPGLSKYILVTTPHQIFFQFNPYCSSPFPYPPPPSDISRFVSFGEGGGGGVNSLRNLEIENLNKRS